MTNAKPGELMPTLDKFDPTKKENWRFHDEYEFWYIEYPQILDPSKPHLHDIARERGFEPWDHIKQSPPVQSDEVREAVDRVSRFCVDWQKKPDRDYKFIICTAIENTVDLWVDDLETLIRAAEQCVAPTIKSDNTEALYNALKKIKELEAEHAALPQTKILIEALRNCSTEFFKIGDMNMVYEIDLVIAAHSKGV